MRLWEPVQEQEQWPTSLPIHEDAGFPGLDFSNVKGCLHVALLMGKQDTQEHTCSTLFVRMTVYLWIADLHVCNEAIVECIDVFNGALGKHLAL